MTPFAANLRWMLLAAAALVLLAGAVNLAIDPYGLFGAPAIPGVNAKKSEAYNHVRLAKQQRLLRLQPATLLIGNSRVDVGLDPESPLWPVRMQPVVNMGVPGEGLEGSLASLRLALRETPATTIFLGLDFTDFLSLAPSDDPDAAQPDALAPTIPAVLFSTSALADSLLTVIDQSRPYATAMTAAGFNPMADHEAIIAREGHFALADKKNRENLARLLARSASVFHADGHPGAPLQQLAALLAEAATARIRVIAIIYPFHAEFLQSIALSGRGPAFAAWKRAVAARFWPVALPGWALWDFGVYGPETVEPFPPEGDRQARMRYWWEPGHFKAAFGERMLAQVLTGAPGPGIALKPGMIDRHLAIQEARARRYAERNPAVHAYLRGLCPPGACQDTPATPRLSLKM
jgi:hypothetical protein